MKYLFKNYQWEYSLITDDNGFIINSSNNPNNRPHWAIGKHIDWLKEYYGVDFDLPEPQNEMGGKQLEILKLTKVNMIINY